MGLGAAGTAAVAASAIGAAGSLGSSMMKGGSGGTSSSGSSAPWSAQAPYMQYGFAQAQDIYNQRQNNPLPTGPWTAYENSQETNANNALYNQGMSAGNSYAPWSSVGSQLASAAPSYLNNAQGIAQNGIGASNPAINGLLTNYAMTGQMPGTSQVNPALGQGVTGAALGSLGSLGQGQGVAGQVAQAGMNPMAGVNAATQGGVSMATNPQLQSAIQSAIQPIQNNLNWNTLPALDQAANATGNANSSRAGAQDQLAKIGAAQNEASITSSMMNNAYNTGANIGANTYSSGLNSALGAANSLNTNGGLGGTLATNEQGLQQNANQFGVTSQIGASNSANNNALGWNTANAQTQLAGNAQLGAGLTTGLNATNTAFNGALNGYGTAQNAGVFSQQQANIPIQDQLTQWNANDQRGQNLLNDYWNIVGRAQGSQTSSSVTPQSNPFVSGLTGAMGGAATGLGLYQNYKGLFGSGDSSSYDPSQYGYNGDVNSNGAASLQSLGFFNPLS